jgi:hypothetical protein
LANKQSTNILPFGFVRIENAVWASNVNCLQ